MLASPLARIRLFATLVVMAGFACGGPIVAVAIKRTGLHSFTFAVGVLFLGLGYLGLRMLALSRQVGDTHEPAVRGVA